MGIGEPTGEQPGFDKAEIDAKHEADRLRLLSNQKKMPIQIDRTLAEDFHKTVIGVIDAQRKRAERRVESDVLPSNFQSALDVAKRMEKGFVQTDGDKQRFEFSVSGFEILNMQDVVRRLDVKADEPKRMQAETLLGSMTNQYRNAMEKRKPSLLQSLFKKRGNK